MHRLTNTVIGGMLVIAIQSVVFTAAAGNADILEAECHKQLNLGSSGCACIGKRAEKVLNEKQQGLVVAMVTKDQAAGAELRGQMTMAEITGAANFMMETPQICGAQ